MHKLKTTCIRWTIAIASVALLSAGCAGATEGDNAGDSDRAPASQRDDSFLDGGNGKGDSVFNIEEGGARAQALLDFINKASLQKLDDDVSLDVRAAENIVEARSDGDISSLQELDSIPWVGSRAFRKLYEYCQEHGIFEGTDTSNLVHGIEAGSSQADAILKVVNTASRSTLDEDVGLDSRAASNIVSYRNGDDGKAGTADDREFNSLTELAGISWVASRAFTKLAAYADTGGGGGVAKDSARALGAFEVANTASTSTLDDTVGLDSRAAENIVSHREQRGGTRSGNKIESIKELNGIDWVGDASITKLADYAEAQDKLPEVFYGIPVGSRRGTGILRIANDRSEIELEKNIELDPRGAANIVDYREGHDGLAGTDDDQTFESVKQLAGVSYVAQNAFDKLLSEARDSGTVPAETWRDVLPQGRIEARLGIEAVTCYDDRVSLDSFTAHDGPGHSQPRPLEEDGHYRMFGDNPGRLSVRFNTDADEDRIPDPVTIDIAPNGTFRDEADNGGYVWDEFDHSGRITRSGRMFVTFSAELDPFDYSGDRTNCKMELSLPN